MNNIYFSFYPTCPNRGCHEPHNKGNFLQPDDRTITMHCKACGSVFSLFLNLGLTKGIKNYLLNCGANDDQLSNTRLFWRIRPNSLEMSYIDWACSQPKGQFLITWPWGDVRFLPALAIEYAQKNSRSKIAIICNMEKNEEFLSLPSADVVFDHLIYIKEADIFQQEDIKKELFKTIDKNLLQKYKTITLTIKNRLSGEETITQCDEDSLLKCKNRVKVGFRNESGNSIYSIITRANGVNREEILNRDGIFDIILDERLEWSGDLSYNKYWELQVISSIKGVHYPSREISHIVIRSIEDINDTINSARIIFISENMPVEQLFSLIKKSNIDIIAFENVDNFIKDIIYREGWRSRYLSNFLKYNEESTVFMFSTKPQIRHLHKSFKKFLEEAQPLVIHTWDTEHRVNMIFKKDWLESKYPNPCFSLKEQVLDHGIIPVIEYIQSDILDDIFNNLDLILGKITFLDSRSKEIIETYFRDLRKTPLKYIGDYAKPEVFSRKILDDICTLDNILNKIRNIDINIYNDLIENQSSLLLDSSNKPSPLFDLLTKLIKEEELEKQSKNLEVTLVVHPFDVKGCERLLQSSELGELFETNRIYVSTWSRELKSICWKASFSGKQHIIISTETPYLDFNIYKNNIKKIIFIGTSVNLEKTRSLLEKRINEIHTRPIVPLPVDAAAPPLLKEIELSTNDIDHIDENDASYSSLINSANLLKELDKVNDTYEELQIHERYLRAGEDVLMAIGKEGQAILFPINATIHYRDHSNDLGIKELRIGKNFHIIKHLKDVEIFMGKGDIHRSLKVQFTRIMIETAEDLPVESGLFRWNGFCELFYDSIAWICYLLNARDFLAGKIDWSRMVDDELANRIVKSGTTAEDPNYVKRWWEDYEGELRLNSEIIRIPFVEHPRNINDMRKIYTIINEIIPHAQLTEEMAIKSWIAANVIQRLRRSVLRGNPRDLPIYLKRAYTLFRPIVLEIWQRSDKFFAEYFDVITLEKDAKGYKIIPLSEITKKE